MGLFSWLGRLFKIGEANINAQLDKLEDPVKMSKQGINDLKKDLDQSLQGLAEVKALHIRTKKEGEGLQKSADTYETKAILLLQKAERGELDSNEADRLAGLALEKKEQLVARIESSQKDSVHYGKMVNKMQTTIGQLKSQISTWENELKTLEARSKVSRVTAKMSKQMAGIDSKDTLAMLDRMKDKVAEQESLAESYQEMSNEVTSTDDEIDKILGKGSAASQSESLKKLKTKLTQKKLQSGKPTEISERPSSDKPQSELEQLKQKLREKNDK